MLDIDYPHQQNKSKNRCETRNLPTASGKEISANSSLNLHSQAVLDSFALHLTVLDWPQCAAKHYAEIHADLKKRGGQFGAADLMIAAHARAMRAIVITNDVGTSGE